MQESRARRFKPRRAGIINLWDYVDEVFLFGDGRLVLRGHNGAGKTKALEVLFPFVLDGRTDARRLDPFSGENRTMKDNLLYRGNDAGYGYVWMEFTRPAGPAEPAESVTIGIGLQARRHQEGVTPWFFVVDGVRGKDFDLVQDRRPLTRAELEQHIGKERVLQKARDYRLRIDERLFGLREERYEQMLSLVLTLRKPQLSKDLDPASLSKVLARGLRPLDDELLDKVAKSFEDLELAQRELEQLVAADEALQQFVTLYRAHVRANARHRVDHLRSAAAHVERKREAQAAARAAAEAAQRAEMEAEARLRQARRDLEDARARRDALRDSPAYQAVVQVDNLEHHLREMDSAVGNSAAAIERQRETLSATAMSVQTASDNLERTEREHAQLAGQLEVAAREAGIVWTTDDLVGNLDEIRPRLRTRVGLRKADLSAVHAKLALASDAERKVETQDRAVGEAQTARVRAEEHLRLVEDALQSARDALETALVRWAEARPAGVLEDGDTEALRTGIVDLADGASVSLAGILNHRMIARRELATKELVESRGKANAIAAQIADLEAKRDTILAETDDAPESIRTRLADRSDREGAPLWRLVRFREHVDPAMQAGVESALEAAGILDAWVSSSAGTSTPLPDDAFLVPRTAAVGGTLADVLIPEEDQSHVGQGRIASILASIAFPVDVEGAEATITEEGGYRVGPILGRHRADQARYIGATARAEHRRRRVETIEGELARLKAQDSAVRLQIEQVEARRQGFAEAVDELPKSGDLVESVKKLQVHLTRRDAAEENERTAVELLNHWKRELAEARLAAKKEAVQRALPHDPNGLAVIHLAVDAAEQAGNALLAEVRRLGDHQRTLADWTRQQDGQASDLEKMTRDHEGLEQGRSKLRVQVETLRASMGADPKELKQALSDLDTSLRKLDGQQASLEKALRTATEDRVAAEKDETTEAGELNAAVVARDQSLERLLPCGASDLAAVLDIDAMLGTAASLGSSFGSPEVSSLVDAIDTTTRGASGSEDRRKSALSQVNNALNDLSTKLGSHYRSEWQFHDDILRVTITDDEGANPVGTFAAKLASRRREQEALLTVREREVFEDALLNALCRQIHSRTVAARELVQKMDAAMRLRRMSSGKTVSIAWQLDEDLPPDRKAAVRLLDFDPANLGPEKLDDLRRYFSEEVKSARQLRPGQPYGEILATVLDYREWRRFVLNLINANGETVKLTKERHSKLSGGEKASSLHIPLFAAAHAQFSSALPTCPRLVALDEAFAGIDVKGKPELLSLTVEFDLDLFMTGFDLWVTYAGVPMAAHYDLLHVPNEHTVSALLLLWDGSEIVEGDEAEAMLRKASAG